MVMHDTNKSLMEFPLEETVSFTVTLTSSGSCPPDFRQCLGPLLHYSMCYHASKDALCFLQPLKPHPDLYICFVQYLSVTTLKPEGLLMDCLAAFMLIN